MPTLISELTPLQNMWLYENQLTRGDSYEEKWHRFDQPAFDSNIFRCKQQRRKLPFDDHNAVVKMRRPNSPLQQRQQPRSMLHQTSNHGPRFPHTGEKLTWAQSRDNLKVYYDHYGNCNVPQKYKDNRKLGRWVNKQRKKKKNPTKYGALTQEQVADLDSLGFTWNH